MIIKQCLEELFQLMAEIKLVSNFGKLRRYITLALVFSLCAY